MANYSYRQMPHCEIIIEIQKMQCATDKVRQGISNKSNVFPLSIESFLPKRKVEKVNQDREDRTLHCCD